MDLVKQQIAELEKIDVATTKRPDFDSFWTETVDKARSAPLNLAGGPIEYPIRSLDVRDLTFEGLDGTEVHTWLILPPEAKDAPVGVVICYHGAGGSRQTPAGFAQWTSMGLAVIAHDFRMQSGRTGSNTGFTGSGQLALFNLGIGDRDTSYLYHTRTDALRTVEIALATPEIDDARICVNGGSQGGAASLAIAALHPGVTLCCADVPSCCWLEKRLFDQAGGAAALGAYLQQNPDDIEAVCTTLSYYDNLNLADRITCPVMVSVGLKDPVCPASNAYAAYNQITAPKEIWPYPFGGHGGGGMVHNDRKLAFVARHFLDHESR